MFEAARPEWGGTGKGVGRGEGWEGVGKRQTGVGTAKEMLLPPQPQPSAPSGLHSAAGQLGVP